MSSEKQTARDIAERYRAAAIERDDFETAASFRDVVRAFDASDDGREALGSAILRALEAWPGFGNNSAPLSAGYGETEIVNLALHLRDALATVPAALAWTTCMKCGAGYPTGNAHSSTCWARSSGENEEAPSPPRCSTCGNSRVIHTDRPGATSPRPCPACDPQGTAPSPPLVPTADRSKPDRYKGIKCPRCGIVDRNSFSHVCGVEPKPNRDEVSQNCQHVTPDPTGVVKDPYPCGHAMPCPHHIATAPPVPEGDEVCGACKHGEACDRHEQPQGDLTEQRGEMGGVVERHRRAIDRLAAFIDQIDQASAPVPERSEPTPYRVYARPDGFAVLRRDDHGNETSGGTFGSVAAAQAWAGKLNAPAPVPEGAAHPETHPEEEGN